MIPLALASPPAPQQLPPFYDYLPWLMIIAIFYFIVIQPMRKQKQHDALINALKPGDKIIIAPGIFVTVHTIEKDTLIVRVDDHTKMTVKRSTVTELQSSPAENTKEKR
jgi:preprotein translocase subunit YajC